MPLSKAVADAKGVLVDGRLHNVRTRHQHLRSLFCALDRAQDSIVQATLSTYPKRSRQSVRLALAQIQADIQYEASQQNELSVNKTHQSMAESRVLTTHLTTLPMGVIGISAYDIHFNPLAAIFGPLVSAISAGCPVIITAEDNSFAKKVGELVRQSLDKEAYAVIYMTQTKAQCLYEAVDKVVTYSNSNSGEGKALHIQKVKSNIIIVDQSLVPEKVYRAGSIQPAEKHLRVLQAAAKIIIKASRDAPITAILVSENITSFFTHAMQIFDQDLHGVKSKIPIISCRSSEHIIDELRVQEVEKASLYVFADAKQGTYFSRYTKYQSCVMNCAPLELLTSYVPCSSAARLNGNRLLPLWPTSLFSEKVSVIGLPSSRIESFNGLVQPSLSHNLSAIPYMKRKKPTHLDYFPTGFKITALPTLLTTLGLIGFGVFKTSVFAYHNVARYYALR